MTVNDSGMRIAKAQLDNNLDELLHTIHKTEFLATLARLQTLPKTPENFEELQALMRKFGQYAQRLTQVASAINSQGNYITQVFSIERREQAKK